MSATSILNREITTTLETPEPTAATVATGAMAEAAGAAAATLGTTGPAAARGAAPLATAGRPWLASYATGVPRTLPEDQRTLPDVLAETVREYPDRTAIAYFGARLRYRDIDRASARLAHRLLGLGLRPGEPVLTALPNLPQALIAHFGILRAGGVVAAVSPLLTAPEIATLRGESGARIAIVFDAVVERVAPLVASGAIERLIVASPEEYLPLPQRLLYPLKIALDARRARAKGTKGAAAATAPAPAPTAGLDRAARARVVSFRAFLRGAPHRDPGVRVSADAPAAFQFTGGTSGLPKGAVLTHRNLVANANQVRAWLPALRTGEETILAAVPFFHAYGTTLCLHLGIALGATLVLVPRPDPQTLLAAVRAHRPTVLPGVPALYAALLAAVRDDASAAEALGAVRWCVSGAAPLPQELRDRFAALTGARMLEGYGLSEASPAVLVGPADRPTPAGAVGLPLPGTDIRLVGADGADVCAGERGELWVRGPQVMRGYWRRDEETAAVLTADGWLKTGDIATIDAAGFVAIVDRQKEVIITNGENVYPREIEEVLYAHPDVLEAAVVPVPHPTAGQIARAFVVARPGRTIDEAALVAYCAERLAKHKAPRKVVVLDTLPKSPAGKILKRLLIAEATATRTTRTTRTTRAAGTASASATRG